MEIFEVRSLFDTYFGEYKPYAYKEETTITTTTTAPDGTVQTEVSTTVADVIPDGLSGVDVPYVLTTVFFMLICVCIFRFLASGLRSLFGIVN